VSAVPIISIPFAFGRAAASAVHQADVPAGARQGLPVRFDLTLHRGAALQRCIVPPEPRVPVAGQLRSYPSSLAVTKRPIGATLGRWLRRPGCPLTPTSVRPSAIS
jgi:hypothetical protein